MGVSSMDHVQTYMDLFVGRWNDFAIQRTNGSYWRVGRPLTQVDLTKHLQGMATLGSYVINERGQCRFAVFDDDTANGLQRLHQVQAQLARLGIPAYLERSRRGGHLWVFFTEPVPASQGRASLLPYCPSDMH